MILTRARCDCDEMWTFFGKSAQGEEEGWGCLSEETARHHRLAVIAGRGQPG